MSLTNQAYSKNYRKNSKKSRKKKTQKHHSFLHFLGKTFLFLFILFLLLVIAAGLIPVFEHDVTYKEAGQITGEENPDSNVLTSLNWMIDIPDETNLADINIPGSHDAGTRYIQPAIILKCQDSSIAEQLNHGYRYLDIRLGTTEVCGETVLTLCHSSFNCTQTLNPFSDPLYLDVVLNQCYQFLQENPSETIIFNIKQENVALSCADFENLLNSYIQADPDFWYLTDTMPELGETRGKIVLCRRYQDEAGLGAASGIYLNWTDQGDCSDTTLSYEEILFEENFFRLFVQDRYTYNTDDKWKAFSEVIDENPRGELDYGLQVSINFLSTKGSWYVGNPYYFAYQENRKLLAEMEGMSYEQKSALGWTIVDFGSEEMAEAIYMTNYLE